MCGGAISVAAPACPFCGETFPGAVLSETNQIWRQGRLLVMEKEAKLPFICVMTNQPALFWLTVKMYWHPPIVYVLLIFPCLYLLSGFFFQNVAMIEVGLGEKTAARRFRLFAGSLSMTMLAILQFAAVFWLGSRHMGRTHRDGLLWVLALNGVLCVAAAIACAVLAKVVSPARITATHVFVKGCHPDFLARFPEFPGD